MANYISNHPALPPLASGVNDSPAGAIASVERRLTAVISTLRVASPNVAAPFLKEATKSQKAAKDKVHKATKREFCIVAENATGAVAAPPWAMAMQQQMNNIQARQVNLSSSEPEDPIELLRNATNALPPGVLPATRLELDTWTNAGVANLLLFYNIPKAPIETQRRRLKRFLGVR